MKCRIRKGFSGLYVDDAFYLMTSHVIFVQMRSKKCIRRTEFASANRLRELGLLLDKYLPHHIIIETSHRTYFQIIDKADLITFDHLLI